jgi:hypothetical protein
MWIFLEFRAYNSDRERSMSKKIGATIMLASLPALLSSCMLAVYDYPGAGPPVERFQRSGALASGATLTLRNFDGNIDIQGWAEERVEVYAEKLIPLPDQARVSLWSSDWRKRTPRIEYETSENYVKINTQSPDKEGRDCVVDYFISVPHSVNLREIIAREGDVVIRDLYGSVLVDLQAGNLIVDNFSGSLAGLVTEGSIQATLYDLRETDKIHLTARRGDITLHLEADVNAQFEGSAPKGEVFIEFETEDSEDKSHLSTQLGSGAGASVSLTALEGDIRVRTIQEVKKKR